ncbi:MAG: nickel pincer cofactor biosynthesis protein LarC [Promethearchaeota archaeon]|jgi:uncharacterized protein (TIGR00299 family) protein
MRVLYADLNNSGISGDMFLASLLGLVPEPDKILNELKELKNYLSGVSLLEIEIKKIFQSGIQLNRLKITIKESKNHRSAKTLKKSLNSYLSDKSFSESAKIFANQVLDSLIRAEAEVHDKLANEIHLHELSSIDTLLDIIGVTTVLERIDFFSENFKIFCSKIPLGGGKVKTAHGILTVPAPATLKILESSNLITYGGPIDSELVTPTGIALLSNLNPEYLEYIPEMTILKTIYSTGQKEFANFLNTLRLFYGETKDNNNIRSPHFMERYVEQISILETDVDDVSGEIIGNLFNKLKNEDILDIQIIPSFTKKNRPSQIIRVLCFPKDVYKLSETMILELGTLGVRHNFVNRVCVDRTTEKQEIEIKGKKHQINFKISFIETDNKRKIVNIKPEYEDLKKISENTGIPVREIQFIIQGKIGQLYRKY